MDYKKAYLHLFNAVTDAITELYSSKVVTQEMDNGLKLLKKTQADAEEILIQE